MGLAPLGGGRVSRTLALAAAAMAALGAGAAGCSSGDDTAAPRPTTAPAGSTAAPPAAATSTAPPRAPRPAPKATVTPDLRGVAEADARRIRGYPGWTVLRGRPTGDLAALGAAHRGGVKRIVVDQPAARIAPGGRQRFPYPVGTTIVKTAGPAAAPELIAIMVKVARDGAADGGWDYLEYLRQTPSAPLALLPGGEGVCTGCHMTAERAQGTDWVFSTLR